MNIEFISSLIIPFIMLAVSLIVLSPKKNYFDEFLIGAKEGAYSAFNLLPTLIALIVALSMFSASGAVDFIAELLAPVCSAIGVPSELLPLLITRPVSGSAASSAYLDLLSKYGADSFAGLCASVIMGSSDTLIYVIAVYFGAVSVKKTRHTSFTAFIVMLFCIFLSCAIARTFFT